jgi:hypothetical protein
MTKIGFFVSCVLVLALGEAIAGDKSTPDVLLETIESQRLIFHWRHEANRLATVLVYTCPTCEVQQKFIGRETRLVREGAQLDISILEKKVEWDGHVTISTAAPEIILRVEIFE